MVPSETGYRASSRTLYLGTSGLGIKSTLPMYEYKEKEQKKPWLLIITLLRTFQNVHPHGSRVGVGSAARVVPRIVLGGASNTNPRHRAAFTGP